MPASPTPAQSDASRLNGALSCGPASPEGKARSAANGTRHGLRAGPFHLLPGEDPAALQALFQDLSARYRPVDEVERHWVEELAFAYWRQRRADNLEAVILDGDSDEGLLPKLPSLGTLLRYRARIERDLRQAETQLELLRQTRPRATAVSSRPAPLPGRPSASAGTHEPEPSPATPPVLSRPQRRRLEALARQQLKAAA
jgi:hypothetical protein